MVEHSGDIKVLKICVILVMLVSFGLFLGCEPVSPPIDSENNEDVGEVSLDEGEVGSDEISGEALTYTWYEDEFVKFQYPEGFEPIVHTNFGYDFWTSSSISGEDIYAGVAIPDVILDRDFLKDTVTYAPSNMIRVYDDQDHDSYSLSGEVIFESTNDNARIKQIGPDELNLYLFYSESYATNFSDIYHRNSAIIMEKINDKFYAKVDREVLGSVLYLEGDLLNHNVPSLILSEHCDIQIYDFDYCAEMLDMFFSTLSFKQTLNEEFLELFQ